MIDQKECIVCGNVFYRKCTGNKQREKQKHCSKKCNTISFGRAGSAYNKSKAFPMPETKLCIICGNEFGKNGRRGPVARGSAKVCSRQCADKYKSTQPYKKTRRFGLIRNGKGRQNRRMIVFARDDFTCKLCGLREPMIMQVDHKIERHKDDSLKNSLDNLWVLCPNCHAKKTVIQKSKSNIPRKHEEMIPRVKLLQNNPEFLKELIDKN